ncbi:MAG TPA: PAS domain S-box protein [Desulfitobacteriaceae bacterium]|nr:PAS domain S-box protein [Desulfitobacteriaceae bacterium]
MQNSEINVSFTNIQNGFFILDREWRFRHIDKHPVLIKPGPGELIGKVIWEVSPGICGTDLKSVCLKAMATRMVQRLAITGALTGSLYNIIVFPSSDGVSVYWQDITRQKQIEMELIRQKQELKQREAEYLNFLREKQKRQAFLLKLSDSIMMLADPIDIHSMAALVLGSDLAVDRAFFAEIVLKNGSEYYSAGNIYHEPQVPLPPGLYPLASLGKLADENKSGRTVVVCNLETEPGISEDERPFFRSHNIGSWVSVPLFRNGKFAAVFVVQQATPRMWTAEEIELMEETAGRTWAAAEHARAEVGLQESERKYRELVKYAPAGICEIDYRNDRFYVVNDVMCELTGYSRDELLEMSPFDILDDHSKVIFKSRRSQWLKGKELDQNVDYKVKTKDGREIYASLNVKSIKDENGKLLGAAVIAHDITERRKMEKALSESEEKYRTLFNSIAEGFCIIEVIFDAQGKPFDGRCLEVNPGFTSQTGLSNVPGQLISELVPETEEYWLELCGKVAVSGLPESMENEFKALNRWFVVYAFKMGGQESRKVAVIFSDITARKKSEQKNLVLIEQLRQADQNKNTFLNTLSHELRNPLASIMMSLSLLDRVSLDGEQAQRALEIARRQGNQLTHLVDDLLDITRIDQNKITLKKERVELRRIVQQAVADYQGQFTEKGISLEIQLTADPIYLEADPARLTQIIGNLLHNAAKFTVKGDKTLVTVSQDLKTKEAVIRIKDSGIGIKPELLPDLFQPFMQVDSTLDRSRGGLGLGLAIVKGMVELHGGSVAANSEGLGYGTQFTVRLPIKSTDEKEQGSNPKGLFTRSLRILVIEDIPDIAEILCSLLGCQGHEVIAALNGPEGISKAKEFQPEVVICDIGLPGMNGYEVAGSLRSDKEFKDTFLIALSGYAQPDDLEQSRAAGFNVHLAKPVELSILQQTLSKI